MSKATKEKIGLVKYIAVLITIITIFLILQPKNPTKILINFSEVLTIDCEFQSDTAESDD